MSLRFLKVLDKLLFVCISELILVLATKVLLVDMSSFAVLVSLVLNEVLDTLRFTLGGEIPGFRIANIYFTASLASRLYVVFRV